MVDAAGRAPRAPPRRPGTALGLAISQGIVETHGGVISVRSEARGSTLHIELPCEAVAVEEPDQALAS
ncbi:MAG TPA: ATP-binding protein [Gaiellaceae bacterium]|nr:ATP-binding protein [Gaiellaceae bacterium]